MTPSILIVDDEPAVAQSMEALLIREGYDLYYATNGVEGLTMARSLLPDVVLLDLMMPVMDGLETCRRLREDSILAEIPVLMITAFDEQEMKLQALDAGVDDFLSKPIDRLELRARLRAIIRIDRYRKLHQERSKLEKAVRDLEHSNIRLQKAYDETIEGWSRAMDLRDKETEGHSQRVTTMTVLLARQVGICEETLVHIRRGALLHDLGKLGVPDNILLKPDKLTDAEWAHMRMHPTYAYEMLHPIEYLHPALDIPYCHHEKWDGSGYPRGLKGTEIPLCARLFSLADTWDALTSDRPYRQAWSVADTVQHIQAQSGLQFDPDIVPVFLMMIAKTT